MIDGILHYSVGFFHSLSMHLQCLYMAPVVIIPRILLLQPREREDYKRQSPQCLAFESPPCGAWLSSDEDDPIESFGAPRLGK